MPENLRIIFMGTPDIALASAEELLTSGEDLIAVVTQPDKPKGRGRICEACPVKNWALVNNIPVLQPERARDPKFLEEIKKLAPDLIVVHAFGQILPKELLDIPKFGVINVHASLLPKYRGAAPVQWAILNGEVETGVTIMQMEEKLDTGPILLQQKVPIEDSDTSGTLLKKLSELGRELLISAIKGVKVKTLKPIPQDDSLASYAPPIKKEQGKIDWNEPAGLIWRKVRAFNPWPGAFVGEGEHLLKIWKAEPADAKAEPGVIIEAHKKWIEVACAQGSLRILELQPAGKKRMTPEAFLAGHKLKSGERFGLITR